MNTNRQKILKRALFRKSKNYQKCTKTCVIQRRWTIIALRNLIFYFWSNIELTWHECSFMSQIQGWALQNVTFGTLRSFTFSKEKKFGNHVFFSKWSYRTYDRVKICKKYLFHPTLMYESGLGTPFFSVRYVTFFYVLKGERYILFRSFSSIGDLSDPKRTLRSFPFFSKERKRTGKT